MTSSRCPDCGERLCSERSHFPQDCINHLRDIIESQGGNLKKLGMQVFTCEHCLRCGRGCTDCPCKARKASK